MPIPVKYYSSNKHDQHISQDYYVNYFNGKKL